MKNKVAPPSSSAKRKKSAPEKIAKGQKISASAPRVSATVVLKSLEKQAAPLIKQLERITIQSNEDFGLAGKQLGALKQLAKQAAAEEHTITDPLNVALKAAKAHFRPFFDALAGLETQIKADMQVFISSCQNEAKRLEGALESGQIKRVSTLVRKQTELQVSSDHVQIRKVWKMEILDAKKIPREYLTPDEDLIRETLKGGRTVPGCEWKQVETLAI